MRSTRTRVVGLLVGLSLLGAVPAATVEADSASPQAVAAKSCRSGYVHAVLPSGHKCLRNGQYCSRKRSFQRVYHRKGFHCKANRRLGPYN
jgi:hypothetical protein